MKNLLFVVGAKGLDPYEDCREFVNKNQVDDLMLVDIHRLFSRLYYKKNISQDFKSWVSSFSPEDIAKITSDCIKARIAETENTLNNIVITGDLSLNQIKAINQNLASEKTNVVFMDATPQLLFRNLSLRSENELDVHGFLSKLESLYKDKYSPLISLTKKQNTYFYKSSLSDSVSPLLSNILGYRQSPKTQQIQKSYIWPISPKYTITQHDLYGTRPVHIILGKPKFHSGFDITATTLTPVHASTDGVVTYAGLDERILSGQAKWNQRYGKMVEIVDDFGRKQIYAHLRNPLVKEGAIVKQGQVLALSGCSGGARTPHLHFEIRNFNVDHSGESNTINPLELLPEIDLKSLDAKLEEKPYAPVWEKLVETPYGLTDKDIPYSDSKEFIR